MRNIKNEKYSHGCRSVLINSMKPNLNKGSTFFSRYRGAHPAHGPAISRPTVATA
jgi:hypothetical protein